MSGPGDRDRQEVLDAFHDAVNMTPSELEKWLGTGDSRAAGRHEKGGESIGHASGRRIVGLLRTRKDDLSDDDVAHMRKVSGYVHRHLAQRPGGDTTRTTWRYSLMNWGHDPQKD